VCIGNIGIAFAGSYEQLLLWKIFVGFGTGASFVGGAKYIAQVIPAAGLHRAQGFYGASVLLGSGFVIFAVPQISAAFGWSAAFLTTALVAVAVLIVWLVVAPAPQFTVHPPTSLLSLLSHGQLWLLGFVQMASFGLVIVIGSWITELLKIKIGLPPVKAGMVGSLVLLLGIFTRIYGGLIVSKIGYRKLLIGSMILNIIGCFMLAADASSFILALTAIVLIGIGSGLPYSALFNRAVALFPGRGGAAMGLVNMLGIIMILAGAPLTGKITDWTGSFSSAFLSLGVFAFVAMLASLGIKKQAAS
jgi:nitrate/nitrite transporter NarK